MIKLKSNNLNEIKARQGVYLLKYCRGNKHFCGTTSLAEAEYWQICKEGVEREDETA